MILSPHDADRFYHSWFPLLYFVNQRLHLVPSFPNSYRPDAVSPGAAATLRDALWADDTLRQLFVSANPARLGPADLALVAGWRRRITGNFYFFCQLTSYAVFFAEHDTTLAYGVLGLVSPISKVVGAPPVLVHTTLLPFEGKIIYDGILASYGTSIDPRVRARLYDAYRATQRRGSVITSLEAAPAGPDPAAAGAAMPPPPASPVETPELVRARNTRLLTDFQQYIARRSRRRQTTEEHMATISRFAEKYLLRQRPPIGLEAFTAEDMVTYLGCLGDSVDLMSFKHFVRFLRDTGRLSLADAVAMMKELRG